MNIVAGKSTDLTDTHYTLYLVMDVQDVLMLRRLVGYGLMSSQATESSFADRIIAALDATAKPAFPGTED